jgi:hypothetical protein
MTKGKRLDTCMLDFEFNDIVEAKVNLVCCATYDVANNERKEFWLHNSPGEQARLATYLKQFKTFIGYSCVAEARSFLALGLDPLQFNWVDLFLEYRMLTNHNDALQWGKQLVDGKVKHVSKPRPKWEREEGEDQKSFKATHSLAEATYKLTGEIRDTEHKDRMRALIISAPSKFTSEDKISISRYCMEDVVFLPKIWSSVKEHFRNLDAETSDEDYFIEACLRGRYSAHTAIMESRGYPINIEATKNFSRQIPSIIMGCQRSINEQFPNLLPFRWDKKTNKYVWNQLATREWVKKNHDVDKWMKTDTKNISLSLEAFERFYSFQHSYPEGNFGAQMVRFLKLKQSLYGFSDSGGKRKNFWDSVGRDGRVRPYMNIYGAQSSRSQPAASGFMFLKPAWMRALVQPAKGKFLAGIDYGQQEFFVAALMAEDSGMIEAYLSGDPYLHTAKLCGAVPKDGTKEEYKFERDLFKNTTLGISYQMTKYGLAIKLTNDTGRKWTEDEAQEQIDLFYSAYPGLADWQEEVRETYDAGFGIRLPCGWKMFSDNENLRSVGNVPVQGFGASVMRKAVDLAVAYGCKVIFTLHDAIYIEGDVGKEGDIAKLYEAMKEAFVFYFKGGTYEATASRIKLDPFAWSPDYEKDSEFWEGSILVPCSNLYVDERSIVEYNNFSKYFGESDTDLL